jgi:hypothetical protein
VWVASAIATIWNSLYRRGAEDRRGMPNAFGKGS